MDHSCWVISTGFPPILDGKRRANQPDDDKAGATEHANNEKKERKERGWGSFHNCPVPAGGNGRRLSTLIETVADAYG